MIAATGAGMAPVDHELFADQPGLAGLLIEKLGAFDQFVPAGRWLHIDLNYPWIRGYLEVEQT
ncbi:hypothetical protein D3C77_663430 [compost metagenome]